MCLDCGRGRVPVPPSRYRPDLGRGSRPFWNGGFLPPGPFLEDEKKSRIKAGVAVGASEKQDKGRGRRWRLRPVTSARSAGSYREFPVYQKWGQNPACDISSAVTIPKHLLPQQKNRGHTSLLRYERLLFQTGRPTSKITPHETKIEALRGAGKCDA